MSDCERCSNYEYDEMLGEYFCEAPIDQDAWERMLEGSRARITSRTANIRQ